MARTLLSLKRLSFDEKEGKVWLRCGKEEEEVDRIINHLKLTFVADKPPPPRFAYQEVLMAVETSAEYIS